MLPEQAAPVLAGVDIVVAGQHQLWAGQPLEKLQTAAKEPQRMAQIAGDDETVGLLFSNPARKVNI